MLGVLRLTVIRHGWAGASVGGASSDERPSGLGAVRTSAMIRSCIAASLGSLPRALRYQSQYISGESWGLE